LEERGATSPVYYLGYAHNGNVPIFNVGQIASSMLVIIRAVTFSWPKIHSLIAAKYAKFVAAIIAIQKSQIHLLGVKPKHHNRLM